MHPSTSPNLGPHAPWPSTRAKKKPTKKKPPAKKKPPTKKAKSKAKKTAKKASSTRTPRGLSSILDALATRITLLEETVAKLSASSSVAPDDDEFIHDPFAQWLVDPSTEQFRGQNIAIHPTQGIVAHGESLTTVVADVRAKGIPLDEIALARVPDSPF